MRNIAGEFEEFYVHTYIFLIKFGRNSNLYRGFPNIEDDSLEINEKVLLKKLKIFLNMINCYAACHNVITVEP